MSLASASDDRWAEIMQHSRIDHDFDACIISGGMCAEPEHPRIQLTERT